MIHIEEGNATGVGSIHTMGKQILEASIIELIGPRQLWREAIAKRYSKVMRFLSFSVPMWDISQSNNFSGNSHHPAVIAIKKSLKEKDNENNLLTWHAN